MSFRARLLLALLPVAVVPLVLFGTATRRSVVDQVNAQHEARIEELASVIEEDLQRASESVRLGLGRVAQAIGDDPRARAALLGPDGDATHRMYLIDYAAGIMPLVDLDVLRIQADDRILSSGHFRNEYDVADGGLAIALVQKGGGPALAELAAPGGPILALVRRIPFRVGAEAFAVVGGVEIDPEFLDRLERATDLRVELRLPGGPGAEGAAEVEADGRHVLVPFVGATGTAEGSARFVIRGSSDPLDAILAGLDRNLLGASVGAVLFAMLLAIGVASRLGRPIEDLAERAATVNPDRASSVFATDRNDEVGDLSRALDRMLARLRAGNAKLRDAERRAATGDLARQVHHDIRNGLIPIRNVFAHLIQVAEEAPDRTAETLLDRRRTLDTGVAHLHALAETYARLSPSVEKAPCDVNALAREAVADAGLASGSPETAPRIDLDLAPGHVMVHAHALSLRRLLDNLLSNAIQSLDGQSLHRKGGSVHLRTRRLPEPDASGSGRVEITVVDTGRGMTSEERTHAFEDYFTTRPGGTGLGLSIVRRMVLDLGGTIDLDSTPAAGTRFTIMLPEWSGAGESGARRDG